ncbi:hypothetical protein [Polymorphospora rubra]|uniref:hypothetical protein n=1 Tax=Polymorphospora rubra TaxID=338584 RepID=UPI001FE3AF71|nr:hypothetical protein [Polymorphospora rubra]
MHAELRLGRGLVVGYHAVEMLMRRAGIRGLPGSRHPRPKHQTPTASDRVNHFTRSAPNRLWVTDITEHPTREGKVYCADVLDTSDLFVSAPSARPQNISSRSASVNIAHTTEPLSHQTTKIKCND